MTRVLQLNHYTQGQYIKKIQYYHTCGYKLLTSGYILLSSLPDLCGTKTQIMDIEKNKAIIARFDQACIEQNNAALMDELVSDRVINHAAQPGKPNGKESFHHFLDALHAGLSGIKVTVLHQAAENDLVMTHKLISGMHTSHLFGVPASGQPISFEAIEIIRLENGKYAEHWVQNNMAAALGTLQGH